MAMEQFKDVMGKELAQAFIKKGINMATELVAPTLGVKGRRVVIDKEFGSVEFSDDGITVLQNIELEDPRLQLGVKILREASAQTNNKEGDGTTTTAILANELVNEILKDDDVMLIKGGKADILDVKKGIKDGLKKVIDYINENKQEVVTDEQIVQVAKIASNDDSVADILLELFKKLGKTAAISVEESKSVETEFDVVEGMSYDQGFIAPGFMTDPEKEEAVINGASVLVTDYKIQNVEDMKSLVGLFEGDAENPAVNDLLIICDDATGLPLNSLVFNKMRGIIRIIVTKAPGFGAQAEYLKDIAVITGATFVSAIDQIKFSDLKATHLGKADKVVSKKDSTIIVGGKGEKEKIQERITMIENRVKETTSDYDKKKLLERISKLSGGVGVIRVGGNTELETADKKAKVVDAVSAVKSALADGVVAGGGITLLRAAETLDSERKGEAIIKKAIQKPFEQIIENADLHVVDVLKQIKESDNKNYGYDVEGDKYGDMFELGIIDPAKVVKATCDNAVSVALEILSSGGAIGLIRKRDEKQGEQQQG